MEHGKQQTEDLILDKLTNKERSALKKYRKDNGDPISPSTAMKFFTLFLEGYTLDQIHSRHKHWPFGALVDARIRYDWDHKKSEYITQVHSQITERMAKLKVDSLNFLFDLAAVAHVEFKEDMIKYLQDPSKNKRPHNAINSLREYKLIYEILNQMDELGKPKEGEKPSVNIFAQSGSTVEVVNKDRKAAIMDKLIESYENDEF